MVSPDPLTLSAEALMQQRNQAMTESVKGLFIMNGGGAAALLALLQAIGTDPAGFRHFRCHGAILPGCWTGVRRRCPVVSVQGL